MKTHWRHRKLCYEQVCWQDWQNAHEGHRMMMKFHSPVEIANHLAFFWVLYESKPWYHACLTRSLVFIGPWDGKDYPHSQEESEDFSNDSQPHPVEDTPSSCQSLVAWRQNSIRSRPAFPGLSLNLHSWDMNHDMNCDMSSDSAGLKRHPFQRKM